MPIYKHVMNQFIVLSSGFTIFFQLTIYFELCKPVNLMVLNLVQTKWENLIIINEFLQKSYNFYSAIFSH
jgi:hypothetical protein